MPFRLIGLAQAADGELGLEQEEKVRGAARHLRPQAVFCSPHPAARATAEVLARELGAPRVEVVEELGLDPDAELEAVRHRRPGWGEVLGGILRREPPPPLIEERVIRRGLQVVDEKLTELWQEHRRELVIVASARLLQAYLRAHQGFRADEAGSPLEPAEVFVATYPDPYLGGNPTLELPGREREVPLGTIDLPTG